jgi:hypothetical protein
LAAVDRLLADEVWDVMFHHGDCVGADVEAHKIALTRAHRVTVHPPIDDSNRARLTSGTHWRVPKPYLVRNADIVSESDVMIACPFEADEQPRGGTWATIRMTRKAGKPLALVLPDGTVSYERWPK